MFLKNLSKTDKIFNKHVFVFQEVFDELFHTITTNLLLLLLLWAGCCCSISRSLMGQRLARSLLQRPEHLPDEQLFFGEEIVNNTELKINYSNHL